MSFQVGADPLSADCRSFVGRQIFWVAILKCYPNVNLHCGIYHYVLVKEKCAQMSAFMFLQRTESCNSESLPWWQTLMCYRRWAHWIIHSSRRRYGTTTKSAWYDHKLSAVYLWNGYLARTLRKIVALCQLSLHTVGSKIPQDYSFRSQSNSWPYWLSDFKKI